MTPERSSTLAAASLVSVMFINMLGFGIVIPLLPFYGQALNAAPWQIALIFSAFAMGGFFGEPVWGRLSDRVGRKPLLLSTVTGTMCCYLALAFAPDVWTAFAIRFAGGLASGNGAVMQATSPTSPRLASALGGSAGSARRPALGSSSARRSAVSSRAPMPARPGSASRC